MNTLKFDVYKNTLKRRDGFNPVLGEKNYTKIKCYFTADDWDKCTAVTANFIASKDNIVKSTVSLTADDKAAVFDIPSDLEGDKIYISLTGSYLDDNGDTATLNTNIVGIDRNKGMLPQDKVNIQLFEQIITLVNNYSTALNEKVANVINEIVTARDTFSALGERLDNLIPDDVGVITTDHLQDSSIKTNKIADNAVEVNKLSKDLITAIKSIANKANSSDVDAALKLKADKADTLEGYGITDAYTIAKIKTLLSGKLDNMPFDNQPTFNSPCYLTSGAIYKALLGKVEQNDFNTQATTIRELLSEIISARGNNDNLGQRLDGFIPDEMGAVTTFNLADSSVTTPIIENGAVNIDKLSADLTELINDIKNKADASSVNNSIKNLSSAIGRKADINALNALNDMVEANSEALQQKYDSANIEYGTATLEPYSTQTDKTKSVICEYKKIGNTIVANVHLVMNECTVGSGGVLHYLNMPFRGATLVRCVGVSSSNNYICKGQITTSAWFQVVYSQRATMSFADGEEVDFTIHYKILGV